jgi:hypothetical protein
MLIEKEWRPLSIEEKLGEGDLFEEKDALKREYRDDAEGGEYGY